MFTFKLSLCIQNPNYSFFYNYFYWHTLILQGGNTTVLKVLVEMIVFSGNSDVCYKGAWNNPLVPRTQEEQWGKPLRMDWGF
jgi:hypothetical protein